MLGHRLCLPNWIDDRQHVALVHKGRGEYFYGEIYVNDKYTGEEKFSKDSDWEHAPNWNELPKFRIVPAGEVDPMTTVIVRSDYEDMKCKDFLVINLEKDYAREVYPIMKKYGYNLPFVEDLLDSKILLVV